MKERDSSFKGFFSISMYPYFYSTYFTIFATRLPMASTAVSILSSNITTIHLKFGFISVIQVNLGSKCVVHGLHFNWEVLIYQLFCFSYLGLSSSRNHYGQRVITREADLVTAHEFGHNWGSEHDPDSNECSPSASQVS